MRPESITNGYRTIDSASEFAANVCACLNGKGGNILAGADVRVEELLASIAPNAPVFYRKDEGGMHWVDVPQGNDKPYSFDGRFYVMRDDNAVPASVDEIKEMLLASQVAPLRW